MSAPRPNLPPDLDDAAADGVIAHWSDDDVRHAAAVYAHTRAEAARWQDRCERWTRTFGKSIWRKGHPADREKLRQRGVWRYRARVCFEHLTQALDDWQPTGRGH